MTIKKTAALLAAITGLGTLAALPAALAQIPAPPVVPYPGRPLPGNGGVYRPNGTYRPYGNRNRGREAHPAVQAAIRNLDQASYNLRTAKRDFGGHRERAAALINQARSELQAALTDDRR